MAARITDILPFLLITLLCVGLVEGGYQALEHFGLSAPGKEAAIPETVSVQAEQAGTAGENPQHDYTVILQRNLFGPPPGKGETAATAATESTEDLQTTSLNIVLMGTINGGKDTDRAIILDKTTKKQQLYEAGDAIQGAIIKEILRGKVILAYNGKDEMLDMSEAAKVRSTYVAPVQQNQAGSMWLPPVMSPGSGTGQQYRQQVSPRGTPRRVINRPRAIRPSRIIRKQ